MHDIGVSLWKHRQRIFPQQYLSVIILFPLSFFKHLQTHIQRICVLQFSDTYEGQKHNKVWIIWVGLASQVNIIYSEVNMTFEKDEKKKRWRLEDVIAEAQFPRESIASVKNVCLVRRIEVWVFWRANKSECIYDKFSVCIKDLGHWCT